MNSKVRVDDDLMAELKSRARIEQMSVTRTLNHLIRAGLAASTRPCEERERYEEATMQTGRPRVETDRALALATALEDEEIIRKVSSCLPEISSKSYYQADLPDNQWLGFMSQ